MSHRRPNPSPRRQFGQSLVEVALVLPLILLIIAGLTEVSNLIVSQSKLDTAVRRSARFGAQGGIDAGIRLALLQTVTPTLDLEPQLWDVYVIRATVADDGNHFISGTWSLDPIYGTQQVRAVDTIDQSAVQDDILENLRQHSGDGSLAANHNIVAVMAFHQVPAILAMDNFIRGLNSVRAFSVMRIVPVPTALVNSGCPAFPIAVEMGARSLNGAGEFPTASSFEYPEESDEIPVLGDFFNLSRIPAATAIKLGDPGQLFVVEFNAASAGDTAPTAASFDFVRWDWENALTMEGALGGSLVWPGNTNASCADPAAGDPGWYHPVTGCSLDNNLQIGDPVRVSTADILRTPDASLKEALEEHIERGRTLRIVIFDDGNPPPRVNGSNRYDADEMRRVNDFAIVRVQGFNLQDGERNWIMFQLVSQDNSCGVPELPVTDTVFEAGCTLTRGYWQTHPDAWPDPTDMSWDGEFGGVSYTNAELDAILATVPAGDMTYQLIHQLIATKLNIWNGAAPESINDTVAAADEWLSNNLLGSDPGNPERAAGEALKTTLDNYNMGVTGPGHCP